MIIAIIGCAAPAHAADPWTDGDTVRQLAVSALYMVDWGQTRYIAKHPCRGVADGCDVAYYERGPARRFIGAHPSTGQVDAYFAASLLLNAGVAYLLPRGWRETWQYGSAGYELAFVLENRSIGIGVSFPWH